MNSNCKQLQEVVSKPQIRFKGKASRGLKTERTRKYVSISIWACDELSRAGTTQPLGLRWDFDTTSNADRK
jgi:hypothetical protein